jgi:circadian clock protein KaiB
MPKMPDAGSTGIRLCLFVANETPRSIIAIENIRRALMEFVDSTFALEVVNVFDDPDRALSERVLVTPTLLAPASARRIVGDLSERSQLHYFLQGLPPT